MAANVEVGGNVRLLADRLDPRLVRGRDRGPSARLPRGLSNVNLAHLHLVMNHVPTVGSVAALGAAASGIRPAQRSPEARRAGSALRHRAADASRLRERRGRAITSCETGRTCRSTPCRLHQDVGALRIQLDDELAGFVAWVALWQWRRRGRPARGLRRGGDGAAGRCRLWSWAARQILAARFAIRRSGAAGAAAVPAGDPDRFMTSAITQVAVYSRWAWPAAEAVHFLGLSLSFGVLLAMNLRLLGFLMRQVPFADVHRLLPWGMLGFGANLITGMFFFVGQPGQYVASSAVLLEGRLPDDRRRELSVSDGVRKAWHRRTAAGQFDATRRQGDGDLVHRRVARRAVRGPDASVPRQRLLRRFLTAWRQSWHQRPKKFCNGT